MVGSIDVLVIRDNTVYFITARCRDCFPAFQSEDAKRVFWDRFGHWAGVYGFVPWVTSLMSNHYHALGYLKVGENLGPMMQRIHGSVAKLVNDLLPQRRVPSGVTRVGTTTSTGVCATSCSAVGRTATRWQSVRHGIVSDHRLSRPRGAPGAGVERVHGRGGVQALRAGSKRAGSWEWSRTSLITPVFPLQR